MTTRQDMTYRPLGRCGTKVSVFSLGGWTTYGGLVKDNQVIRNIILTAFEAGVNFFDIADIYAKGETEKVMGSVLNELPRNELVISSKTYFPMSDDINDRGLSRKHIMESIDRTLQRLGTDYLDIYFCHRFDEETPLEETVHAMDDLVRQGKILYWGTSEWTGQQMADAHAVADRRNLYAPRVEQPQYSLLARKKFEGDTRPQAMALGMGLVLWSPLASGMLSGKYDDGVPADSRLSKIDWLRDSLVTSDNVARVKKMKEISDRLDCTRAQLALAWAAQQTGVSSVITGATRIEQLKENLGALKVKIDEETLRELDELFPLNVSQF